MDSKKFFDNIGTYIEMQKALEDAVSDYCQWMGYCKHPKHEWRANTVITEYGAVRFFLYNEDTHELSYPEFEIGAVYSEQVKENLRLSIMNNIKDGEAFRNSTVPAVKIDKGIMHTGIDVAPRIKPGKGKVQRKEQ